MVKSSLSRLGLRGGLAVTSIVAVSSSASAHHAMDGALPDSFGQGLLSGLAHPVIGIDHFAFVIAVGIACAFLQTRWVVPALFIAATIAGCLLKYAGGVTLPMAELVIAASVVAVGAVAMSGRPISEPVLASLVGVAGLFHGSAYASSIIGAETTPLVAYLIGFAFVQSAVLFGAMYGTCWLAQAASEAAKVPLQSRLAGAMVTGVGAAILVENLEAIAFPGV